MLFSDYVKTFNYESTSGSNKDYFRILSKRRKELYLPSYFCSTHYQEMHQLLHQCPCFNPPHARNALDDDDHDFIA